MKYYQSDKSTAKEVVILCYIVLFISYKCNNIILVKQICFNRV